MATYAVVHGAQRPRADFDEADAVDPALLLSNAERGLPLVGREARVMPLARLGVERVAEIDTLASLPWKPPRYLNLGGVEIQSRAWSEWHWRRGIDPDAERPRVTRAQRAAVLERDGLTCGICGGVIDGPLHIDHIVPLAAGGAHAVENMQPAHARCNLKKGAS